MAVCWCGCLGVTWCTVNNNRDFKEQIVVNESSHGPSEVAQTAGSALYLPLKIPNWARVGPGLLPCSIAYLTLQPPTIPYPNIRWHKNPIPYPTLIFYTLQSLIIPYPLPYPTNPYHTLQFSTPAFGPDYMQLHHKGSATWPRPCGALVLSNVSYQPWVSLHSVLSLKEWCWNESCYVLSLVTTLY